MTYTNWFFDKADFKRTPSIVQDGISFETEQRYRREGARFINKVGTQMKLRYDTMATGVVYFHRFYMLHSFKQFPRYITACCCLFLAGKVEETPKKCKDIIKTGKNFITDSQFATFGEDPKEEVLTLERILLQTINFDLQVDHPYGYLLKYAKVLNGDKDKLQKMVQMAWTFINDSMCTTISLQWEPEVIAIAIMFLAGKLTKFEVVDWEGRTPRHEKWWDMFVEDISTDLLEDICHQVLDLYSVPMPESPKDSPTYESPNHNQAISNPVSNSTAFNSELNSSNNLAMPNVNHPPPTHSTTGPPMILPPGNLPNQVYPPPIPNAPVNLQQVPIIHNPSIPPPQPGNFANYKPHPVIPMLPHTGPPIPIGAQPPPFYQPRPFVNLPPTTTGPHLPPNGHQFTNGPPNI